MAIGHVTYLDLPLQARSAAANRVREQIRQAMANPFLAADQRALLVAHLHRITHWEHGRLPIGAPLPSLAPEPERPTIEDRVTMPNAPQPALLAKSNPPPPPETPES